MEAPNGNYEFWQEEIIKFLKGELSISEEKNLNDWVNSDIGNFNLFREMKEAWLVSVTIQANTENVDQKWGELLKKSGNIAQDKNKTRRIIKDFKFIAAIAAMLVIAFLSGAYLLGNIQLGSVDQNEVTEIISPLGAKSQIILPDGTQVWLNAGSKLSYRKSFNEKERIVLLQGEAFFKVTTNKNKPFVVQTSKMNIRALGTAFNVKAYGEDKAVTATLVEGIIEVEGKRNNTQSFKVKLKPNESITLREDDNSKAEDRKVEQAYEVKEKIDAVPQLPDDVMIEKQINTDKYTSWKDPLWQIEAENLQTLSLLLSRRFNVVIHNQSDDLVNYRFTGTIRNETLEQVMEILTYTTPLKYKIGKGEVWWGIDPVQKENYSKILDKQ